MLTSDNHTMEHFMAYKPHLRFLLSNTFGLISKRCPDKRFSNSHEYQTQEIVLAFSVAEAAGRINVLPSDEMLKSQVPVGKCGLSHVKENSLQVSVHVVPKEQVENAEEMLGRIPVTKQTSAEGRSSIALLLPETDTSAFRSNELLTLHSDSNSGLAQNERIDCLSGRLFIIGSKLVEAADLTAITKQPVGVVAGTNDEVVTFTVTQMGLTGSYITEAATLIAIFNKFSIGCDCSMLEIDTLAVLKNGHVLVCEAKMDFSGNPSVPQISVCLVRADGKEKKVRVYQNITVFQLLKWYRPSDLAQHEVEAVYKDEVLGAELALSSLNLIGTQVKNLKLQIRRADRNWVTRV